MKILLQIGVVFGVYWGSQCIEAVLPSAGLGTGLDRIAASL